MGVFGVKAMPGGKLNDSSIFVNQQLQRGGNEGEGCGGQGDEGDRRQQPKFQRPMPELRHL